VVFLGRVYELKVDCLLVLKHFYTVLTDDDDNDDDDDDDNDDGGQESADVASCVLIS